MAYIVELQEPCRIHGCSLRAVREVRDRWNGSMGKFCRPHARMTLREQQAREDKAKEETA